MLTELYIENFALIDRLTVSFAPGLNILTGETGAGKSIVIDAINVLLGERAGTELIRTGTSRAVLQATFDLGDAPHLLPALEELGVEPEEGVIIFSREVAREGRNLARINGRTCPVNVIRQVGDLLVDLHGQHEHQSLLREEHHINFLDALGDADFIQTKAEVAELSRRRSALRQELHELQTDERDRLRAIDLLTFQVQEIEKAALTPGEEEELAAERNRLANAEKLHESATTAYQLLYEGEEGRSVLDALGEAEMQLAGLLRYDESLEPLVQALQAASVQITDACRELGDYRDGAQFDPERLNEVEERLELLGTLKRKYGESLPAVLAYGNEKRAELDRLSHHEERLEEIGLEIRRAEKELAERALQLSAARAALAERLAADVQAELTGLGMPKAVFRVDLAQHPQEDGLPVGDGRVAVTLQGIDAVAFHISANPGEPPKPLAKIASGGELSRIMLALKAVSARGAGVPTLIFDEIDTGIGGRTAEVVGDKLAQVARVAQVISVTHLAQLAFYADRHFLLEKETAGERTVSRMRDLSDDERVEELARLQAGGRVTDAVREHIRAVLDEIHGQHSGRLF
jgi:DNA repair protein RecN (Recombination protein N)